MILGGLLFFLAGADIKQIMFHPDPGSRHRIV